MKKILFLLMSLLSTLTFSESEVLSDNLYTTYKNTISKWDGQVYQEIMTSCENVDITVDNKYIYIFDSRGGHDTYKFGGFHKRTDIESMSSSAIDENGKKCIITVARSNAGEMNDVLSLTIIYDNDVVIKYYLKEHL